MQSCDLRKTVIQPQRGMACPTLGTDGARYCTRRELLKRGAIAGIAIAVPFFYSAAVAAHELDPAKVAKLRASLKGYLISPGDSEYEAARRGWSGRIDPRRPAMIVRCAETSDIQRAIEFARTSELMLAVRSGGHGYWSMCDKGIVLDLSPMKGVDIDHQLARARVQMGVRVAELDQAAHSFGLAPVLGQCSTVGLGGLTLGGGEGNLLGKYGMTCDNVLSAEVVLSDGRTVRASGRQHNDLFWGICGGAGNFGAVTEIDYQLHPIRDVIAGTLEYRADRIADVLRRYRDFAPSAPDELSVTLQLDSPAENPHPLRLLCCWCGALEQGEQVLARLRWYSQDRCDRLRRMTYLQAQALSDYHFTPPVRAESCFITQLSDEIIRIFAGDLPPSAATWSMMHYHGAVTRNVGMNAFPLRQKGFNPIFLALSRADRGNVAAIDWTNRIFAATAKSAEGAYVNYIGNEGKGRVRESYGSSYGRLVKLKDKYDPTNFFCMNHNIKPP
jgi:FAD/FMN-containing dehydrogenase